MIASAGDLKTLHGRRYLVIGPLASDHRQRDGQLDRIHEYRRLKRKTANAPTDPPTRRRPDMASKDKGVGNDANALGWKQDAANKAAGGDLSKAGPLVKGLVSGKTPSGQGN